MQRSWLIRAGGWLWAVTGRGPSAARRVVRSPERLQQSSGEANVSPPRIFPRTLCVMYRHPPGDDDGNLSCVCAHARSVCVFVVYVAGAAGA